MRRSAACGRSKNHRRVNRKKTADAIRKEVARDIERLVQIIFTGVRKTGRVDLEGMEMLVRSAMHQAGATVLTELLQFAVPDQRTIPCPCGQQARYRELRSKTVLTAVGKVEVSRPWYLCAHCHRGQFPADAELDIRLQNCRRPSPETVGYVLDRLWCKRHPRAALLSPQRPFRGLLGGPPGGLASTSMSRTPRELGVEPISSRLSEYSCTFGAVEALRCLRQTVPACTFTAGSMRSDVALHMRIEAHLPPE